MLPRVSEVSTGMRCVMPVYTYQCEACGVRFERQQSFTEAPLTRCPECTRKALRKVFLPVGIVFKGSGFYATDHRSPSGGNGRQNGKAESSEKAPVSDSSPKTESGKKEEKAE
jgi:putative FmdB family regulatory protein